MRANVGLKHRVFRNSPKKIAVCGKFDSMLLTFSEQIGENIEFISKRPGKWILKIQESF